MGQATAGNRVYIPTRVASSSEISGLVCRVRVVLAATLAVGAALVALGVPAASATTWNLPASDLSAAGDDADAPQVAVGPDGTTAVVWTRYDGSRFVIEARTRAPGASAYGPVQDLANAGSDADRSASKPQVAVAPDGAITVLWARVLVSGYRVQGRTRPAGASDYGPVQDLSDVAVDVSRPEVAVAPDGTTTVVWSRDAGSGFIVEARTRPAGAGDYGPVQDLSDGVEGAVEARVAVARDGATTVVWKRTLTGARGNLVQARTRPAGASAFGATQDLSEVVSSGLTPQLAVAPDGTTTVVWTLSDHPRVVVQARTRPAGASAYGATRDLSVGGENPSVAVGTDGTTAVVWQQTDPADSRIVVQSALRPAGSGDFEAGQTIGTTDSQSTVDVAVAPDGAVTAVWAVAAAGDFTAQAATRAAGTSAFGPIQTLAERTAPDAPAIWVAAGPDGAVTAVWRGADGTNAIIRTASSAPTTYPLTVQRAGTGAGGVSSAPAGIACGATCEARFTLGSTVTLTAAAAAGSTFTGWSGAGCSGTAACTVAIGGARSVTATFAGTKPALRVAVSSPARIRAGRSFTVGVRVTNQGPKRAVPARAGRASTTATSLRTCLVVPRNLYVAAAGKGGTIRGRSVCWSRASLAAGTWTSYTATLRSSPYVGGPAAVRATVSAAGESGVTGSAARARSITMTDPQPASRPARPTG